MYKKSSCRDNHEQELEFKKIVRHFTVRRNCSPSTHHFGRTFCNRTKSMARKHCTAHTTRTDSAKRHTHHNELIASLDQLVVLQLFFLKHHPTIYQNSHR